jgi:hypothetical protein
MRTRDLNWQTFTVTVNCNIMDAFGEGARLFRIFTYYTVSHDNVRLKEYRVFQPTCIHFPLGLDIQN